MVLPSFGPKAARTVFDERIPAPYPVPTPPPKPVPSKPKGPIPWFLDLDLFDYVTKTLKIPTGPFRIRLNEDNEPIGGVELAPGAKLPPPKGPPVGPTPPGREIFDTIEQDIIDRFTANTGKAPTDEELAILTVVAGYQPNRLPVIDEPTPTLTRDEIYAGVGNQMGLRTFLALGSTLKEFEKEQEKEARAEAYGDPSFLQKLSGDVGTGLLKVIGATMPLKKGRTEFEGFDFLTLPVEHPLSKSGRKTMDSAQLAVDLLLGRGGKAEESPAALGALFAAGEAWRGATQSVGFGLTEPPGELAEQLGASESLQGKIRGDVSREIAGESLGAVLPVIGWPGGPKAILRGLKFGIKDVPRIKKIGLKAYAGEKLAEMSETLIAQRAKLIEQYEDDLIGAFAENIGASLKTEKARERLYRFARDPEELRSAAETMVAGGGPPQKAKVYADLADQMEAVQGIISDLPTGGQLDTLEWLATRRITGAPKTLTNRLKQAANDVGVKYTDDAGQLRKPKDVFDDIVGATGDIAVDAHLQFWPRIALVSQTEWGKMISRAVQLRREINAYETLIAHAKTRSLAAGRTPQEVVDAMRVMDDYLDSLQGLGITDEGEEFLRQLAGKRPPVKVTDRMRRIAKDHGIIVEEGMTAQDVGAALAAKRGELSAPSPQRAAAAAKAAGVEDVTQLTVEQITALVSKKRSQLLAINAAEAGKGPTIPLDTLVRAMGTANLPPMVQFDIWRMLRFQFSGDPDTWRLTNIVRRTGGEIVEEAPNVANIRQGAEEIVAGFISDDNLRTRAMPAVIEALEAVGSSDKLMSELAKRFSAVFQADMPLQGRGLRQLSDQLKKWYGKNVKRLAKHDIGVEDADHLVFTSSKGVVREFPDNALFRDNTRVVFGDSGRLVDELEAMTDIPTDFGRATSAKPVANEALSILKGLSLEDQKRTIAAILKKLPDEEAELLASAMSQLPKVLKTTVTKLKGRTGTSLIGAIEKAGGGVAATGAKARIAEILKFARTVKIPELQRVVRSRTKGLPKPTKKIVKDARNKLNPARKELGQLEATIEATRELNINFQKKVNQAMSTADEAALAADPDLASRTMAVADIQRQEEALEILQRRMKLVGADKAQLSLADEEMLVAYQRLTSPEELGLLPSLDPRVQELGRLAPARQRSALTRLFRIMQPDELIPAGEQLAGRSRLPVVGPLIQHITGRFSNNPLVLGVFWQYQVGRAMGGLVNSSHMASMYRIAKNLAPRKGGLGRLMDSERLEIHLADRFIDTQANRRLLGLEGSMSKFENEAVDLYKRQLFAYVRHPNLYKNMGDDFEGLARIYKMLDDDTTAAAVAMGIKPRIELEAARESLLVKSMRPHPSDEHLKRGIARTWQSIAEHIATESRWSNKTLKQVVKQGEALMIDFQSAKYRQVLNRVTVDAIADMNVGTSAVMRVFENSNDAGKMKVIREAQRKARTSVGPVNNTWTITGLEDWPKEMQGSLKALMGALTGPQAATGVLGGLQELWTNVMMWRLVMDASIFGIQGSFYMAARGFIRPGVVKEPVQMFEAFRLVDDEHFIQWVFANQDELMAYFANGLEVGRETLVATAANRPLLIEHIPELLSRIPGPVGKAGELITSPLGIAGRAGRGLNDIMFDRWMLWMKTNLIRQHLDGIQMIRQARAGFRPLVDDMLADGPESTGFARLADDLGGVEQLYLASPEDTLRSVIRVVNQQLGGLPRSQTALGLWRETAESFMLFVPGFWRARMGLLNAALTKPFSVEGQLAMSAVFREHAFWGALGAFVSWQTGQLDKFNYTDPRKADFLAMQFGDDWVPTIPSAASSTRILARLVGGMNDIKDPKERLRALQILVGGRMHPIVQGAYEASQGRDFLGNTLDGKWERFLNWGKQGVPIFAEQMTETVIRDEPKTRNDYLGVAVKGLAEFMGKNIIPRNPLDYLDDDAGNTPGPNGEYGRRWLELGAVEQAERLGLDPSLEQHLIDYEEQQHDRSTSAKIRQSQRYDDFETIPEATNRELIKFGDQLDAGAIDDEDYRKFRRSAFDTQSGAFDRIEVAMIRDGFDPEQAFERRREGKDKLGLVDQAVLDYRNVDFERFVSTDNPLHVEVVDFDGYDAARLNALSEYSAEVQQLALDHVRRNEPQIETRFRLATDSLDTYFNIPKYVGLTSREGALLDTILGSFAAASSRIRTEAEQQGVDPAKASQTRVLVAAQLLRTGHISTQRDRQILALALTVARKPAFKKAIVNPKRGQFVIANQDLSLFYGFTANDVPDEQKHLLPYAVQARFNETFQAALEGRLDFLRPEEESTNVFDQFRR